MKKNSVEYDYNKFDYLHITVKDKKLDDILSCYGALGWEVVFRDEDPKYFDIMHVIFRRKIDISDKDERQLLQVYIEGALNQIGKVWVNPTVKCFFFTIFSCLLALGVIAGGLCIIFLLDGVAADIFGIAVCGFGVALFIPIIILSVLLYKREIKKAKKTEENALREIDASVKKAQMLAEGGKNG